MPSQVNVQGMVTRRPGVYTIVDASALSGKELDVNNVAIVGEFPFLEDAEPVTVTSFRRLAELQFSDMDLLLLASILYKPANDTKIGGGPNSTTLVNVAPVTQAQNTFNDVSFNPSILMKAVAWGTTGNKIVVSIGNGTDSGQKFSILRDGRTEVFDNIGLESVISFEYTDSGVGAATDTTLSFDNTDNLRIVNKIDGLNANLEPTKLAFDGAIKVTTSVPLGAGETLAITIIGTNKATGAPLTEILNFANTDSTKTTSASFSACISINKAVVGFAGTWEVEVDAFALDVADYKFASDLVARVNAHASYTAINEEPEATSVKTTELDFATSADLTVKESIDANVFAIVNAFKLSLIHI